MKLTLVKTSELPLGRRVLRLGDQGEDVQALQESLKEAGFYFGSPDGRFGFLTMEAVLLWQKTFDLKPDGIAGPEVVRTLVKGASRAGRIIHTVKAHETLSLLSQRFGVRETAWGSLAGQGNPQKRVYPGMKLFLPEKMMLVWENKPGVRDDSNISGIVCPGWRLDADGALQETVKREPGVFYLIQAEAADWEAMIGNRKQWGKFAAAIKDLELKKVGLDLRGLPLQTSDRWRNFLKYCTAKSSQSQFGLIVLPLLDAVNRMKNGMFWTHLPHIAAYARYLMLEPEIGESPEEYIRIFEKLPQTIRKLSRAGVISKTLFGSETGGILWSRETPLEPWNRREVPFREAKMLQAMFFKNARIIPQTKLTAVDFSAQGQMCTLVYRNGDGWADLAKKIARSNMAGMVIRNFSHLKDAGPRMISGAFAVAKVKI